MTPDPEPPFDSSAAPSPVEVLRWCERAASGLWFPSESTTATIDRDSLIEPTRVLREAGLIVVGDWIKGRGQGYALTVTGKAALRESGEMPSAVTDLHPTLKMTNRGNYDRHEITRQVFEMPRPAIISPAILMACAIWFTVGIWVSRTQGTPLMTYMKDSDVRVLLKLGAVHGPEIYAGEWWRLFASCFVHIGAVHLLANLFSLGMVGPLAEGLWGRKRFAILFLASGVASSMAAAALNPNAVTAGASGAIWGLQTAVLLWILRFRHSMPEGIFSEWLKRLLLVIGVNAVISFAPGISWESHLVGGIVGFTAGAFLDWTRFGVGRRQRAAGVAGMCALVATAVGGFVTVTFSSPDWAAIRRPELVAAKRQADGEAATSRLNELRPTVLSQLQQTATVVLLFRKPGIDTEAMTKLNAAISETELKLTELVQLYAAAPGTMPVLVRDYATIVKQFLNRLRVITMKPAVPAASDWASVAESLDRAEATWLKLAGPQAAATSP